MSKNVTMVDLAREVLTLVEQRKLCGQSNHYMTSDALPSVCDEQSIAKWSAQAMAINDCHVCALGALMVAAVQHNDAAMPAGTFRAFIIKHLSQWTTPEQLSLIEAAFEVTSIYVPSHEQAKLAGKLGEAVFFGERYDTDEERLVGIMQNIVQNNGVFVP